jgi:hypothetical protein
MLGIELHFGCLRRALRIPMALFYGGDFSDAFAVPGARLMAERDPKQITVTVLNDGTHKTAMRMSIPRMFECFSTH